MADPATVSAGAVRSESRGLRPLPCGIALLALTALLLFGPLHDQMNGMTACLILLHLGLALFLLIPSGRALLRMSKQARVEGRGARFVLNLLLLAALLCALTGLFLWLKAASGHSLAREGAAWNAHIIAGFAAAAGAGWWSLRSRKRSSPSTPLAASLPAAIPLLLMLGGAGALWGTSAALPGYSAEEVYRDLTATNAAQAQNVHFPAGVRVLASDGTEEAGDTDWSSAPSSYCGREGCHAAAYQQWRTSAHHLAGSDPIYLHAAEAYVAKSGRLAAQWCEGCHAPLAASQNRKHSDAITTGDAFSGTSEGVNCVACHAVVGTPTRTGNGRFALAALQNYPFAEQKDGWPRRLHEFLLRVRPGPHQRAFLKPERLSAAESCSACHRQSFNVPQNHYQFVRGPDEYGEWQAGPFSGRVVRPAGLTVQAERTCQDCHFPRDVRVGVSHESLGANTALPALTGDTARLMQREAFLKQKRVTLDLFALRLAPAQAGQNERWIVPLDAPLSETTLYSGETVSLDVVVANRSVGHSFPAGYEDIKSVWLEVRLLDAQGRTLLSSGIPSDREGRLPPDTHEYRMIALDRAGNPLTQHNLTEQVTTLFRRAIAPGSADIARYTFTLPGQGSEGRPITGPLHLRARLFYRPLRPDFAREISVNSPDVKRDGLPLSALSPITLLAESKVELLISRKDAKAQLEGKREEGRKEDGGEPSPQRFDSELTHSKIENRKSKIALSERFIDYGLGLLAPTERPDLSRALRAFQQARELAPDRLEPLLGLGRVYLAEAEYLSARAQFEAALRIAPGNRIAQADLGVIFTHQGQYDRALELLRPLAAQFPQDNRLQFDFGLALFGSGSKYAEAAEAFERALAADPENAAAHIRLKRCYQKLRRLPEMQREAAVGRYLAEDSLGRQLKEKYLNAHPKDRQAAQPLPEHALRPPEEKAKAKRTTKAQRHQETLYPR